MADETLMSRFKLLVGMHRPGESKEIAEAFDEHARKEEKKELSPEAQIHIELHDWAKGYAAQDVFLAQVLRPASEVAKKAAIEYVGSHPLCSFQLGYLKCAEDLLEKFEDWARQAAPRPSQGE